MTDTQTPQVTDATSWRLIRAADRHMWNDEAIDSRQSFPATGSFDLAANAHGMLLVHNDDIVDAGAGFDTHQHRDAEIVTWVVEGALHHRDSQGSEGVLTPGVVQRMSAGSGIRHSERNASTRAENQRLRVVQMWIAPEYSGGTPSYAEADVNEALADGGLVTIVSGLDRDASGQALTIGNSYVALHAARLLPDRQVTLPPAPFGHLFVVSGTVTVSGLPDHETPDDHLTLDEGDALRTTGTAALTVTADAPAEILFWEMHTSFDAARP